MELNTTIYRDGEGIPVVLVHAFPIDHHLWDDCAAELIVRANAAGLPRFPIWAPDMPGAGEGPIPTAEQTGAIAQDGAYAEGYQYDVWRLYLAQPPQFAQVVEELTAEHQARIVDFFRYEEANHRDSGDYEPMTAEEALEFLQISSVVHTTISNIPILSSPLPPTTTPAACSPCPCRRTGWAMCPTSRWRIVQPSTRRRISRC